MLEKYLDNKSFSLLFLPFFLGSITVFSFQPFNYTLINFIVLPIFFFLITYIKKKSKSTYRKKPFKKNLFMFGTAFGFGYYLSGIHWITNSLTFDDSFKILIPFGLILIPLFLSLFFSLITVIIGSFVRLNLGSLFLLSGSLAFSDFIRAKILTGFPWNLWAYSFSWSLEIIQILNPLGLFAFNLVIVTIFMTPSIFFFKMNLVKKFLFILIIPLSLFFLYVFGNMQINKNDEILNSIGKKYRIKVISPNFELRYNLENEQIKKRLSKLIRYSEPNQNLNTLFVWPEGIFSGYSYNEIKELKETFSSNFKKNQFIIFGINRLDKVQNEYYNSLVVVNNKMEIVQEYKKQKLVPFGEFLPFENILSKLGLKKITEGHGSFLKGKNQGNIILGNLNILPLICYEVIFTELIQQSEESSNLIINISEDGWFGNSIGPHQHFAKAIFRAVEQNLFLIRSTNKGISAIISNKGVTIKKVNINETGSVEFEVPLLENQKKNKNDLIFFVLLITYILIFRLNLTK